MNTLRNWLREISQDRWLLLAILSLIVPLHVMHTASAKWMRIDGGLYAEVARNVRDGLGLVSWSSLYHAGNPDLPAPTSLYPLWPALLGLVAKVVPLATAAHWLPASLYVTALLLGYAWGRRVWPEPLLPGVIPGLHAGHVLMLLLGLQRDFVGFSVIPYTEPLSLTLLFGFFLRLYGKRGDLSPLWALEIGVWAALIYFTRAQMIVVPVAVIGAFGLRVLVGPDRGRALVFGVVGTLAALAPLLGWWLHLRTFLPDPGFSALLRFDQNRVNDLLERFDPIVVKSGLWATIVDRLSGIPIAFGPLGLRSFAETFYAAHFALPLALPFLAAALVRFFRAEGLAGALRTLRHERGFAWSVVLATALGGLLSIHLAHKQYNGEWYFDRRESLIAILAFFLALAWMFRQARPLTTVLGLLVLGTTVMVGGKNLLKQGFDPEGEDSGPDRHLELVNWLNRAGRDGKTIVAMDSATCQRVSWRVKNVGYQWFYDKTSYADLKTMTDRLGARYVIFHDGNVEDWRFLVEGAGELRRDFEELDDKPSGFRVLRRRVEAPPERSPPQVVVVGVDGASWRVIGPMIEAGELPTFQRLNVLGAADTSFDTLLKTASPVVWTTVATGRLPQDHGVTDYTQEIPGKGRVPITSDARKVPALWNLASDAGRRVAVVNWWASWPSEPINGIVVSDHANPAAAGWMDGKYWTADVEELAAMNADTWPGALAASLKDTWIDPAAYPLDTLAEAAQLTPTQKKLVERAAFNERSTYSWLKTFYAVDVPHHRLTRDLLVNDPHDLTLLYLRGPDPVQHYAWDTVEPYRYTPPPAQLARDRGVVEGVYRYVDEFLAELLDAAGPDALVIVLSDHGAEPCVDARAGKKPERPGCHTKAAKGVLFLTGPAIRPGARIEGATPLDIAPTVAWAMGLPVAEDLPGRVLAEAFTEDFRAHRGQLRIPTWGTRTSSGRAGASPADDSMLEQLRGLGYIE